MDIDEQRLVRALEHFGLQVLGRYGDYVRVGWPYEDRTAMIPLDSTLMGPFIQEMSKLTRRGVMATAIVLAIHEATQEPQEKVVTTT